MFGLPTDIQQCDDTELKQILQETIMLQNGTVASLMAKSGVRGNMNYGVSVPDLQRIANKYGTNHKLAQRLCALRIREAKILASLLFDADCLTESDLSLIYDSVTNIDLAENLARNIICKITYIEFYNKLIINDKWRIVAAIHATGWAVVRKYQHADELVDWFIKNIGIIVNQNYTETIKPLLSTLQSIADLSENTNRIDNYMQQLSSYQSEVAQTVCRQFQPFNNDF